MRVFSSKLELNFKELYESRDDQLNLNANEFFFDLSDENILNDIERSALDEDISETEVAQALKTSNNGSSPGLDGLPCEVYKFFWNDIKHIFLDCINFSFFSGSLPLSQRKGMITLVHKGKGLEKEKINNWRPITLTNADYKIVAKVLARRLNTVIDKLIHKDQHAFIKGRLIADMLREIDDIVEDGKSKNSGCIVLSLDYAKAFDTLSTSAIKKALNAYGFGDVFVKWIAILLKDRLSCVTNSGFLSSFFDMGRGVRQGCPISPLLFILTVELLGKSIRKDKNIRGISIPEFHSCLKIKQYADDTTLFLRDFIDFREVLSKIKLF